MEGSGDSVSRIGGSADLLKDKRSDLNKIKVVQKTNNAVAVSQRISILLGL
jgi:hypothetical protein